MNQKGFANIVIIVLVVVLVGALWYMTLIRKSAPVEQPQINNLQNTQTSTPPPANTISQNQPANTSKLTQEQVLNGYNECKQQFKNGNLEIFNSFAEYNNWLSERKAAKETECAFRMNLKGKILLADLDNDGILEAVTLIDSCTYKTDCYPSWSAGELRLDDISLIVFKNIGGSAIIVDERSLCSNANGECNMSINSVNGSNVVVDFGGAHLLPPDRITYKFINGKLVKQ